MEAPRPHQIVWGALNQDGTPKGEWAVKTPAVYEWVWHPTADTEDDDKPSRLSKVLTFLGVRGKR